VHRGIAGNNRISHKAFTTDKARSYNYAKFKYRKPTGGEVGVHRVRISKKIDMSRRLTFPVSRHRHYFPTVKNIPNMKLKGK
jgi:hypothetical protein